MKAALQLKLLGNPDINLAGKSAAEALSSKAQAILYYLAVTGQPQSRAALATLLWGDMIETAARTNLRKALANLRQALGDFLNVDHQVISFVPSDEIWVDVTEFETIVSGAMAPAESSTDLKQLQAAVELYRGDFLTSFYVLHAPDFENWMLSEQARLRELVIQALHALANAYAQKGERNLSISYLRRLLNLEPWREEAHRALMLRLAQEGQRAAALAQFELCRQLLQAELGVEPGAETVALYEQIRDGASPRPVDPPPPSLYNLPTLPTQFIGREAELADILRRLTDKDCRLLTLVGPGGIGKTRLAIQTAQTMINTGADFFPHGLVFVSLAGVSSTGAMVSAIAEALNFTFYSSVPPRQQLLNHLRERKLLLILDNLEHLLAEGSELISEFLAVAPAVKILVTSREALNLQEAWFHPIGGMAFPSPKTETLKKTKGAGGSLEKYDSIQLFVHCASRVRVEFSLAAEQAHIVRICQLVEGMPLGIELAATWLKMLPADKIVRELERGLDILSSRLRNVPERHRSIRAVFEHSWQLLPETERAVLEQLSVFRGSFTEAAAAQVAAASLLNLAILVEKSLLRVTESGRYQMHELLRQFAAEKLSAEPQVERIAQEQHSVYYLDFLQARTELLSGPKQQRALAEIGQEIENVEIAWRWAADQGHREALDQALESLYNFYEIRSRYQEGKELLADTITQLEAANPLAEQPAVELLLNRLLTRLGCFDYFLGNYEAAHKQLEASLNLASRPGDQAFILRMLGEIEKRPRRAVEVILNLQMLGEVANVQGSRAVAENYFRQSLALSRESGNLKGVAEALGGLASAAASFGDFAAGKPLASECLAISRQLGQPVQLARALGILGWVTNCLGEYRESEACWQESLAISQEIGDQLGIVNALSSLGWAAWCEGGARLAEAIAYHKKSLVICRTIGHRRNLAVCLGDLALAVTEMGEYEQAIQYAHEGLAITEEIGHLELMSYNLYGLGAATCGLGDFQTSHTYLIQSLKIGWEKQLIDHTVIALFYLADLLAKEADLAEVIEQVKVGQKAKALELLVFVSQHPSCWQPIKDRAGHLQAQLENQLPSKVAAIARARAKELTLEKIMAEESTLRFSRDEF